MPFTKGHPFYPGGEKGWFEKGYKPSDETRRRMSETNKRLGRKPPSPKGRVISVETRMRMSLARKGKKTRPMTDKEKAYLSEYWKGKKKSKEHTENIRLAKLAEKNPMWGKQSLIRGENHWNWKGGISPTHRLIRQSGEYKRWRQAVFERDGFTCVKCGQLRGRIEADHIKRFSDYPELRFDINNGRTLCIDCHKATPTYGNKRKVEHARISQ